MSGSGDRHMKRKAFTELKTAIAEDMRANEYSWRQIAHQLGFKTAHAAQQLLTIPHAPEMDGERICIKCGVSKSVTLFALARRLVGGRDSTCQKCRRPGMRKWATSERGRAKRKEWNEKNAAKHKTMQRNYTIENRHRLRAVDSLNKAVDRGAVIPGPCVRCGSMEAQAHHEDYAAALDVVWLCQPHHKERHREMAELGIDPDARVPMAERTEKLKRQAPKVNRACSVCGRVIVYAGAHFLHERKCKRESSTELR